MSKKGVGAVIIIVFLLFLILYALQLFRVSGLFNQLDDDELYSLVLEHRPILHLREEEVYFPTTVDTMLLNSRLLNSEGEVLIDNPLSESDLPQGCSDCYITLDHIPTNSSSNPVVYYHLDKSHDLIQYWFFYVYNNGINDHEGDWEMIQINFGGTPDNIEPQSAGYSQHYSGERCEWSQVERVENRPVVYVGLGSHASYFDNPLSGRQTLTVSRSGVSGTDWVGDDLTINSYRLSDIERPFLDFQGHWGKKESDEYTSGPSGPKFRTCMRGINLYQEPVEWFNSLSVV